MSNNEYVAIDGVKIRKSQPFIVYSGMPRNTSEFQLSEGGKSDNVSSIFTQNLIDFAKNLFHSPV